MRTALIDGDEIAYRISSTYQKKLWGVYKDNLLLHTFPNKDEAIEWMEDCNEFDLVPIIEIQDSKGFEKKLDDVISSIVNSTNSSDFKICISGDNNFRYSLATLVPYKGNRNPEDKPGYYNLFRDYLLTLNSEVVDYLEADDLLVSNFMDMKDAVICSTDKDLRTVPSLNYNISQGKLSYISDKDARYNFYYQLLIGDSTDNIPSPYNLGKVTAAKILYDCFEEDDQFYMDRILPFYQDFLSKVNKDGEFMTKWFKGQSIYDILWEVGNLLYMHRTRDINERWELPGVRCG